MRVPKLENSGGVHGFASVNSPNVSKPLVMVSNLICDVFGEHLDHFPMILACFTIFHFSILYGEIRCDPFWTSKIDGKTSKITLRIILSVNTDYFEYVEALFRRF